MEFLDLKLLNSIDEQSLTYLNLINQAFKIGFESINPEALTRSSIEIKDSSLKINNVTFNLSNYKSIFVIGGGKASYQVVNALFSLLDGNIEKGILNIPKNQINMIQEIPNIEFIPASHPFPDENTINGTHKQIKLLRSLTKEDLVFVVITGGASSLFEVPRHGISFENLIKTYKILVKSNLDITQINAIRKHLSIVKGGNLPFYTSATIIGLYISDVPGNELSNIGSGPTIADPSTFQDCYRYINESGFFYDLPPPVQEIIVNGFLNEIKETPKSMTTQVHNFLLGSNKVILKRIQNTISSLGVFTSVCSDQFTGKVDEISKFLYNYIKFPYISLPHCLIWGGESTVNIDRNLESIGEGGRNQELILNFLIKLQEEKESKFTDLILVSIGTDGIDGNSGNMGAFVESNFIRNKNLDLNVLKIGLNRHDSSNTLPTEFIIKTGQTFSNVGDIIVLLLH